MSDGQPSFAMTVGGQDLAGEAEVLPVIDPSTGKTCGFAPRCTQEELDRAVIAARDAFPGWAATPFEERKARVAALGPVILEHADVLGDMIRAEQGKPLWMAEGEVRASAAWAAGAANFLLPEQVSTNEQGVRTRIHRVPIGVVAGIVPWNYPLLTALMKIVPTLVAGNSLVLKPAPTTPLTALLLGTLIRDHLPPGVLNIVTGDAELGPWLVAHDGVDKISFTGSTAVGKTIMQQAAGRLKRVTLELGGNDPAIVLPDVDVEHVAEQLFWGAFRNSGQVCVATKRVYAHADVFDALFAALLRRVQTTPMGPASDPDVKLGPLQNRAQYDKVRAMAAQAMNDGLILHHGPCEATDGYFFPATLVEDPPEQAAVVQDEAFGPILPIIRFDDVDDVVRRANGTRYGLGASVWSRDIAAAQKVADRLESGTVWVNQSGGGGPGQPLAGHKESGMGVENGDIGLLDYMLVKVSVTPSVAPA